MLKSFENPKKVFVVSFFRRLMNNKLYNISAIVSFVLFVLIFLTTTIGLRNCPWHRDSNSAQPTLTTYGHTSRHISDKSMFQSCYAGHW